MKRLTFLLALSALTVGCTSRIPAGFQPLSSGNGGSGFGGETLDTRPTGYDAMANAIRNGNIPPEAILVTVQFDFDQYTVSAAERAKQRPLLQKILAVFQKEKGSYRELIINSEPLEKRVALLVDGRLEKFEIERESDNRMVGGIYKGRVKNLDPGLKAAFVDIGYSKNAFLHYWDMLPAATDSSVEVVRVNKKKNAPPRPCCCSSDRLGEADTLPDARGIHVCVGPV